jgi:hypothetical protein
MNKFEKLVITIILIVVAGFGLGSCEFTRLPVIQVGEAGNSQGKTWVPVKAVAMDKVDDTMFVATIDAWSPDGEYLETKVLDFKFSPGDREFTTRVEFLSPYVTGRTMFSIRNLDAAN